MNTFLKKIKQYLLNDEPVLGHKEDVVKPRWWQKIWPLSWMHRYTQTENIGQTYDGVEKYKSVGVDKKGKKFHSGEGYAFEDLNILSLRRKGKDVKKVPAEKNGADIVVDNEKFQLKFCRKLHNLAQKLYEHSGKDNVWGSFRYPDQTILGPKGGKQYIDRNSERRLKHGLTDIPKCVKESEFTVDEVKDHTFRGIKSFFADMKDPHIWVKGYAGGLTFALGGFGILQAYRDRKARKKGEKVSKKRRMKDAVFCTIGGLTLGAIFTGLTAWARQKMRPYEDDLDSFDEDDV